MSQRNSIHRSRRMFGPQALGHKLMPKNYALALLVPAISAEPSVGSGSRAVTPCFSPRGILRN